VDRVGGWGGSGNLHLSCAFSELGTYVLNASLVSAGPTVRMVQVAVRGRVACGDPEHRDEAQGHCRSWYTREIHRGGHRGIKCTTF
jgi:hypothetical protein